MTMTTSTSGTDSRLVFVLVTGLTKSLQAEENGDQVPQSKVLKKWFPNCHFHPYEPSKRRERPSGDTDILEYEGIRLLQSIVKCSKCIDVQSSKKGKDGAADVKSRIVFLGHDLGGSVIKKALIFATESPLYRTIAEATRAIFFFAGLHRAKSPEGEGSWERHLASLLSVSQNDVKEVFGNLQTLPMVLSMLSDNFINISGSYDMFNIYEKSEGQPPVIPKYAATQDSAVAESFKSKRRHADLLTLEEGDLVSEWVRQRLVLLTVTPEDRISWGRVTVWKREYQNFLHHLTSMDPSLHRLETRVSQPGSIDWISGLASYTTWLATTGVSFLHVYGPPGSGVTVLTSNIIWIIEKNSGKDICYVNFSFNGQDPLASSEEKMILSLVRQLLSKRPRLFRHTRKVCGFIMQKQCANVECLWALFECLLSHIGNETVLLVVRSIQECSPPSADKPIIGKLAALKELTNLDMKIITTGSVELPNGRYSKGFKSRSSVLNAKDEPNMTEMLKRLVRQRVSQLVKTRPAWSKMEEDITTKFWDQNQNYHSAMARVRELEKQSSTIVSTKLALESRLNSLLLDDTEFVSYSYDQIPSSDRPWFNQVICWVTFSLRPLSSSELAVAVAFGQHEGDPEKMGSLGKFQEQVFSDLPGDVNRIVGYWIKVNDGNVEVTNPYMRDWYVRKHLGESKPMHAKILKNCLKYLSWVRKQSGNAGIEFHWRRHSACQLLDYAALYWPFHFAFATADQTDEKIHKLAKSFLSDREDLEFWSKIVTHHRPVGFCWDFSTSPLKASAAFGLLPLVAIFLKDVDTLEVKYKERVIRESLDLATEQGHLDASRILSAELQMMKLSPTLHKAAETGNQDLLKDFLAIEMQQHSINALDNSGYSPLHYLTQWGKRDGVQLLLDHDAQVDTVIDHPETPILHKSTALHLACQLGYYKVAETLLASGADPQIRTNDGYSCLHLASRGGFPSLVRLLVPKCKIEEKTIRGKTALHLAAMYGQASICEYLMSQRASLEALDGQRQTPLHLAVQEGFLETVRVLLGARSISPNGMGPHASDDSEVSPSAQEKEGMDDRPTVLSPLQIAAKFSHIDILKELLEQEGAPPVEEYQLAISEASKAGHWKSVKVMMNYVSLLSPLDDEGNYSLHLAAREGHVGLVNKFLHLPDIAHPDLPNHAGLAPIHLAAQAGHAMVVEALLRNGTPVNLKVYDGDHEGDQAIHFAARSGHLEVIRVLEKTQKSLSDSTSDLRMEEGHRLKTPIKIAAEAGMTSVVVELLRDDVADGNQVVDPRLSELIWQDPTPLHTYISDGNGAVAQILIKKGYNLNFKSGHRDETPLHIAVQENSHPMIRFLIDNKADLKVQNYNKETPLSLAVKSPSVSLETCSIILEASRSRVKDYINIRDVGNNTALYSASNRGDESLVHLLLEYGPDLDAKCHSGWTALHTAADDRAKKKPKVLELLLGAGASPNITNNYGSTPIFLAAETGQDVGVRLLLKYGAVAIDTNKSGSSALHRAAQNDHKKCVEALVEAGADINLKKKNGQTPLYLAVLGGHDEVVEYLLRKLKNPKEEVNFQNDSFGTPLSAAMTHGHEKIAKMLVEKGATMTIDKSQSSIWSRESVLKFALNNQSRQVGGPGFTWDSSALPLALQYAISSGFKEAVSKLVASDMDVNEVCGTYGTALQAAASRESVDVMKNLLERKEKKADPNIVGGLYGSALNASIVQSNLDAVMLLLHHEADPRIRPESKSKSNDVETSLEIYMEYPVHLAVKRASVPIIEQLLNAGARFSDLDRRGRTLLSHVFQDGDSSKIDFFLSKKEEILTLERDETELTPLMTAVALGKIDIVKRLLQMGADPNARDGELKTPLMKAIISYRVESELHYILLDSLEKGGGLLARDCRGRGAIYWACLLGKVSLAVNIVREFLPMLVRRDHLEHLDPQFAFHAIASSRSRSPAELLNLLRMLVQSKVAPDLMLRDGNGWTVEYTAKRYGLTDFAKEVRKLTAKMTSIEDSDSSGKEEGSHQRGPFKESESNSPKRPTRWHERDRAPCLQLSGDGKTVTLERAAINPDVSDSVRVVARANHPMPGEDIYYFEVTINEDAYEKIIGVGFCEEQYSLTRMLGWDEGAWAYHGDDGYAFMVGLPKGLQFETGEEAKYGKSDTVGCGVDFRNGRAFFTKNDKLLGTAFENIKGRLYPAVCFSVETLGASITANFGDDPNKKFKYENWNDEKNTLGPLSKNVDKRRDKVYVMSPTYEV